MQISQLPDKELTCHKDAQELKENTDRQLNEVRKTMHEQDENINKKTEIIKKNQTNY